MRRTRFPLLIYPLAAWLCGGCSHGNTPPAAAHAVPDALRPNDPRFVYVNGGLDYAWRAPDHRPLNVLDTIGCGCAFLDYNQDGNPDILLVGPRVALYRGDGKGHFKDVSVETGLSSLKGHFLGCAVGDYDNDGYPDVYLTGYRCGVLLHNVGGKRFEDVTPASGIKPMPWGTSAAFADIDGDGKLDLYIGNYIRFGPDSRQYCLTNGVKTSCPPGTYDGEPGRMYRNLGGGRFEDVTTKWGLNGASGKTLGVAFADFDGSGRQSLALANDEMPGELWLNEGGRFKNIGPSSGTAYSSIGQPHAGMGLDWGDYAGDNRLDLTVMTFSTELKPVFHNEGRRFFTDNSSQLGLTSVLLPYVAFGVKWIDASNDGWLDLLITNGHTADNIADTGEGYTYRQPTVLLKNEGGMRFRRVPQPDLDLPIVGRGLAIGDYDNDGREDALIVDSEGAVRLLHNETAGAGHWLTVKLIGRRGNRDGYGAKLLLETAARRLLRVCHADGSYLSSSDPRVHFGLGKETVAQRLTITWPGGAVQRIDHLPVDRIITIEEGKAPR